MPFLMRAALAYHCDILLGRRDMEHSIPQDIAQRERNGVEWN
jgi:hypothetical protein